MAAFFAISSAFLYALTNTAIRLGLRYTDTITGVLISLVTGIVTSFILCFSSLSLDRVVNRATLFFIAAGILGPFLGRLFLFKGIGRVGLTIASTLYENKTLVPVLAAILLLGEKLTQTIIIGVIFMMAGTILISRDRSGGQIERKWSKRDLVFPLLAGACYGLSQVLRKIGINLLAEPLVAVLMQSLGAFLFTPFLLVGQGGVLRGLLKNKKAWAIFGLIGAVQVAAQWCLFVALEFGELIAVAPLTSLSSLFVLILASLFLRRIEKVTWTIALGAVMIVGAVILLSRA